jgi:hypothetical protein
MIYAWCHASIHYCATQHTTAINFIYSYTIGKDQETMSVT